jgi:hypothetical protein
MEISPKLIRYIHRAKKAGMSDREIIDKLLSVGHSHEVIHHHIHHYHKKQFNDRVIKFSVFFLVLLLILMGYLFSFNDDVYMDKGINNLYSNHTSNISDGSIPKISTTTTISTITSITSSSTITTTTLTNMKDALFSNVINPGLVRIMNGEKANDFYIINDKGKLYYFKGIDGNKLIIKYEKPNCPSTLTLYDESTKLETFKLESRIIEYNLKSAIYRLNLAYSSDCGVPLHIDSIEVES